MAVMNDPLIRDLRVPKFNLASTMAEAADEIERLREQMRSTAHESHKTADAYLELRALITKWADADDSDDIDAAGEFACARLALRQAVGR